MPVIPSARACALIFVTNALTLPASQRASSIAMLSADGSISASRACRSVMTSPAATLALESPAATSASHSETSADVTVIDAPSASPASG